jgi:type IV secretory pathway VirB6-like protein
LTFDEWLRLLLLALLYPSMVLACLLFVYLLYRFLGWDG